MPREEHCTRCGELIKTMAFIGTGFCCTNCQKGRPKDSVTPLRKS